MDCGITRANGLLLVPLRNFCGADFDANTVLWYVHSEGTKSDMHSISFVFIGLMKTRSNPW